MYLYFNEKGILKEIINDEALRVGNNDLNHIYIYWENAPEVDSMWVKFKLPSGETTLELTYPHAKVKKVIPYDKQRDLKYFKDYVTYEFFDIAIPDGVNEDGEAVGLNVLAEDGLVSATVRFVLTMGQSISTLGLITFNVEKSVIQADLGIKESQFDYLLKNMLLNTTDTIVYKVDDINSLDLNKVPVNSFYATVVGSQTKPYIEFYYVNEDRVLLNASTYNYDISPATAVVGTFTSEIVTSLSDTNATITRAGELYRYSDKSDSEYLTYIHASIDTSQADKPAVMRAIRINLTTYAWELLDYDLVTEKELEKQLSTKATKEVVDNILNSQINDIKTGTLILINDISPMTSELKVNCSGDIENATIYASRLNLASLFTSKTQNGVTLTVDEDGTIHLNGTATTDFNFENTLMLPKGKFTLCDNATTDLFPNDTNTRVQLYKQNVVSAVTRNNMVSNRAIIFEVSEYANNITYRIRAKGGFTYEDAQLKIMIVVGEYDSSNMPSYEPYLTPISANVDNEGNVRGLYSIYPNTILYSNKSDLIINCIYNIDMNKAVVLKNDILPMYSNTEKLDLMIKTTTNLLNPFTCKNNTVLVTATGLTQENNLYWITDFIEIPSNVDSIFSSKYIHHVGCYDVGMNWLGLTSNNDRNLIEGTRYIRVQYAKSNIEFEKRNVVVVSLNNIPSSYVNHYAINQRNYTTDIAKATTGVIGNFMFSFNLQETVYISDHTFIKNKLYAINSSSDDHSSYAPVTIYSINFENKTATYEDTIQHNLGHANTIDYCEGNDCLILGNGSSDATLSGKIFILPNVSQKTSWEFNDCLVIDMSSENWGIKMNVVWGEHNNENYNIAYVITNDNANVHKILLKKTDGQFNGDYVVLGSWETMDGIDVNQGTVYRNGKLYTAIGHNQIWVTESKLLLDGTIDIIQRKDEVITENGEYPSEPFTEGITIINGYVLVGASDGKIRVYQLSE